MRVGGGGASSTRRDITKIDIYRSTFYTVVCSSLDLANLDGCFGAVCEPLLVVGARGPLYEDTSSGLQQLAVLQLLPREVRSLEVGRARPVCTACASLVFGCASLLGMPSGDFEVDEGATAGASTDRRERSGLLQGSQRPLCEAGAALILMEWACSSPEGPLFSFFYACPEERFRPVLVEQSPSLAAEVALVVESVGGRRGLSWGEDGCFISCLLLNFCCCCCNIFFSSSLLHGVGPGEQGSRHARDRLTAPAGLPELTCRGGRWQSGEWR